MGKGSGSCTQRESLMVGTVADVVTVPPLTLVADDFPRWTSVDGRITFMREEEEYNEENGWIVFAEDWANPEDGGIIHREFNSEETTIFRTRQEAIDAVDFVFSGEEHPPDTSRFKMSNHGYTVAGTFCNIKRQQGWVKHVWYIGYNYRGDLFEITLPGFPAAIAALSSEDKQRQSPRICRADC